MAKTRTAQMRRRPPPHHRGTSRAPRRPVRRRRWPILPLGAVALVVLVVGGLIVASLNSGGSATAAETPAPAGVVTQATSLSSTLLSGIGTGQPITALKTVPGAPPLTIDGKPGIVFVSEESCPFCAAERWPVVIALSHFGTWGGLGATTSSSTDVFPSTATFSFRHATFTSPYLALQTTELRDNAGHPLQALTTLDTQLIHQFDVPPFVNNADQSGAVPFLDVDNRYILAGAQYDPEVLAGLSAEQIAAQLANPASPVAQAVDASANILIAAIDKILYGPLSSG